MAKINITKPTGSIDNLNIISAFKADNNTYIILDSEKMGSMGLPIIYVSKYTTKLEKINDDSEWQNVKNYLKGIISGTNFEYIKIGDNISADEAYYTPLTLPQASFDVIKNRYNPPSNSVSNNTPPVSPSPSNNDALNTAPVMPSTNNTSNSNVSVTPITPNVTKTETVSEEQSVMNLINNATAMNNTGSQNIPSSSTPNITPASKEEPANIKEAPSTPPTPIKPSDDTPNTIKTINFDNDKETFLKACENMFDALITKYQKELSTLEQREQELLKKEAEINSKLKAANEHLANAEAKETVANIAHDNAKMVMDLSSFMPTNPESNI